VGLAGRAAVKRNRRPKVFGKPMPQGIKRPNFHAPKVDVKKVAKQVGNLAERVEHVSEDVRVVSAQTKRMTKNLT
jgi:excinuclease UvrABC helicase subunit UvrB